VAKRQNSSSATTSSGQRACATGNQLEEFVEHALQSKGYVQFQGSKAQALANLQALGGRQYIKQLPVGNTIYDTPRVCDFFVVNEHLFPNGLIIECKWQQSGGSVDEKYPFLLFNVMKTGKPTVILLDGGGYKPAAMEWLKRQVNTGAALIAVWNMREFQKHVNDGFFDHRSG
jgi:hypothetical protein